MGHKSAGSSESREGPPLRLGVLPQLPEDEDSARSWAEDLTLPLLAPGDPQDTQSHALVLWIRGGRASLCLTGARAPGPVELRFDTPALSRRVEQGVSQSLARACGLRHGRRPRILDATAGLGRDAFVLAALGSRVWMVERNPVLHRLLEVAMVRLREMGDPEVRDRLHLLPSHEGNLLDPTFSHAADVIYLDPMFPPRRKRALVKKEMQVLHALLRAEDGSDASILLSRALGRAGERVVVKRPRIAPALGGRRPDQSFVGRSHRFDLYLVRQVESRE